MASRSFSPLTPPTFISVNYPIWAVKMKTYLKAFDLWEVVEISAKPNPLPINTTMAQIKYHSKEKAKKIQSLVFHLIFCYR